jgi:hypothetical protein
MRYRYDAVQSFLLLIIPMSLSPFALSSIGLIPKYLTLTLFVPILFLLMKKVKTISFDSLSYVMMLIIMAQMLISSSEALRYADFNHIADIANFSVILIIYIVLLSINDIATIANLYVKFILIIALLAAISFLLAALGLVEPELLGYGVKDNPLYRVFLTYTGSISTFSGYSIIRPAGIFYESGALAIYIMLAMFINRVMEFPLKNEYLLIVSGLLTLSFGFYISLFIYLIFFYKPRVVAVILISIVFFVTFSEIIFSESQIFSKINDILFRRFELSDGMIMNGFGNRIDQNSKALELMSQYPLFGVSYGRINISSSIGGFVAKHGLIGSFILISNLIFLSILFFMYAYRVRYLALTAIPFLLIINLFHRPYSNRVLYALAVLVIFEVIRRRYVCITHYKNKQLSIRIPK